MFIITTFSAQKFLPDWLKWKLELRPKSITFESPTFGLPNVNWFKTKVSVKWDITVLKTVATLISFLEISGSATTYDTSGVTNGAIRHQYNNRGRRFQSCHSIKVINVDSWTIICVPFDKGYYSP